jgi:predicted nucleic acid-binding protein
MRVFFDTNILVYLFDSDAVEKKERARALFEAEARAGRALLSTQVLQEFYVTVTRKLAEPLDPATAEKIVRHFSTLPLIQIDADRIMAAIARSRNIRISFWDALIVEAALAGGAGRLLSEDLQHGQRIHGIEIENPFILSG